MPITPTPAFSGTLFTQTPFSYTFTSDVSQAVNPSYQFTDSSPAILAATNDASASFSSTTGYVGTGSLGNLIVDYISSNVTSTSNVAPGSFTQIRGMTKDSMGNIYVSDCNAIKKITPGGVVTTFAGSTFVAGSNDGVGPSASFNSPIGLACDANDTLYVADRFNNAIRKITPDGTVTTYAGIPRYGGWVDGPAGYNLFGGPWGVAVDSNSNVYVADIDQSIVRKIDSNRTVKTLVGIGTNATAVDGSGSLYQTYSNVFVTGVTAGAGAVSSLRIVYSFDGQTWNFINNDALRSYVRRVAKNDNDIWVAVGSNAAGWSSTIACSGDGSNWFRTSSNQGSIFSSGYDAAYGNGLWVAVGTGTSNTIASSVDAKTWAGQGTSVFSTGGYGVVWSGSVWVAVGQGTNTMVYSSNGSNWTAASTPPGSAVFDTYGRSVAYADGIWVAVGASNYPVLISSTGSNWIQPSGVTSTDISSGRSVAVGGGTWVLLGNTNTGLGRGFTSSNGLVWTRNSSLDFSSNAFGVMYNEETGVWVATGMNSGGTSSIRYTSTPDGTWNTDTVVRYVNPVTGGITTFSDTVIDSTGAVGNVTIRTLFSTGKLSASSGITLDGNGDIYIADQGNNRIRKFSEASNQLTTYAGSGIAGFQDGAFATARFNGMYDLDWSPTDGNFYVSDTGNSEIRILNSNTGLVSTYDILTLTTPWTVSVQDTNQYYANNTTVNLIVPPRAEVRPSGTRPPGYVIADSLTIPVSVSNRIDASSAAIGGVFNLYKYEPFGVNLYSVNPGASTTDTLSYAQSSAELFAFLSNVSGDQVSFASTNGPSVSYANPLSLVIQDLSGSTVLESISNTVYMNPGRFFPPAANTAYVFYKNEPITPQTFAATISLQTPTSAPSIPAGLSFVRTASNSFQMTGTPLVQIPSSNYKIIGRGLSNAGQTVTVDVNIRVAPERLLMDLSGSSNVFSMAVDTSISNRVVTARCPPYPNAGGNIVYTWFPPLPNGLSFRTNSNVPISSGTTVLDPSSTVILAGAPTELAAQQTSNGYQVTLTATRTTSPFINNTIPFTFSFGEAVVFTPSNLTTLYAKAAVQSSASSNSFAAQTKFATVDSSITTIFSPDLRSDLSLNFVFAQQRAFLTGTPNSAGNETYTVVASNANGFSGSIIASLSISNDQVFFDYSVTPAIDTCYNFVKNRPISNGLTGYYPSPIDFSAYTLSGCNVGFSASGLPTGVTLSNVTTNRVRLVGTTTVPVGLSTLSIDVSCTPTEASNSTTVKYSVIQDAYTFNDLSLNFIENVSFTPLQISASTLAGFPIIQYSSSNLPAGLTLSAAGLLTGPIQTGVDGSFTVVATTGYSSASNDYNYTVVADSILLTTPQSSYVLPAGSSANIPVTGIAYSGGTVSNFQFSNLPNTYGLSIGSTSGLISGTVDPSPPTNVAFAVQGSVGNASGKLDASWNDPLISFGRSGAGPTVTSPGVRTVLAYQYAPITTLTFAGSGTGRVYFFLDTTQLPRGLVWDPIAQTLSGAPVELGVFDAVVYARDGIGTTTFTITFDVQIPRVVRTQTSAGAYTSLVRQYTEVNAAQNARDRRVFPSQERTLGEFMAPDAPSVVTPDVCGVCEP